MDPVTGIRLAASVIQLVTFGIDAARTCRDVYQQGSVSEYNNVDYTTSHLASLTKSLEQSLQSSGTPSSALSKEEKELVNLARNCEDCANTLQKELRKLQTQPRASALDAARKTARAVWKKSSISKTQEQLESYRSTLEMSLLSRLSQRFDTQGLRNAESFASLDRNMQHIITCLGNSQTSLISIAMQESKETRHCISAQIDRVERLHIDDRRYEKIVKSLFYPDISSRQEQVDNQFDGINNSYDWIFDESHTRRLDSSDEKPPQERAPQWSDFASWLKSGHGVYWINGKAGSGKSTLMNHISIDSNILFLECRYSPAKSIDGLLRSIVYQMLQECRELIEFFNNDPLHTWTQSRFRATLFNILTQSQVPVAICLFIDGLDEFDGLDDTVIDMITALADQTHVKVCVSSRPSLAFEEVFRGKPSLKLQDLTFDGIREYAEVKLSKPIQKYVSLDNNDRRLARYLPTRIVKRADGVFLWAIIAIRDVREGLREIADMNELARMIESLPSELEKLFMLMLDRIKPAYKRDAVQFLQIVLHFRVQMSGFYGLTSKLDLCTLHFIHSQRELKDAPVFYREIAASELVTACRILETRLLAHTAGLLELTPTEKGDRMYGKEQDLDPVLFTRINFLHRTVQDFLLNNAEAKSRLAFIGSTEAQVRLSIAKGTLAHLAHFSQLDIEYFYKDWPNPAYHLFAQSLRQISLAERCLGAAQTNLMRSLDFETLARVYPVSNNPSFALGGVKAFMIDTSAEISIDLVGMAAVEGMAIYVCEQLNLPTESRRYSPSLPDPNIYFRNRATAATLYWKGDNQLQGSRSIAATLLHSSNYRQVLARCLQWETDDPSSSRALMDAVPLAETYMLSCCKPKCLGLARILLRAGANPLVRVKSMPINQETPIIESFWHSWLTFLLSLRFKYMEANGKSGGILFRHINIKDQIKLNDIFDTTKALLIHGADINYQLESANSCHYTCHLKRRDLVQERFDLILTSSALFVLDQCFNTEPEFREFMTTMEPLLTTPNRIIVSIDVRTNGWSSRPVACPSAEESKMLWPLIEKWESTGRRDDLDSLQAVMEGVWRAHNPGIELSERGEDSSDGDDGDDDGDNEDDHDHDKE